MLDVLLQLWSQQRSQQEQQGLTFCKAENVLARDRSDSVSAGLREDLEISARDNVNSLSAESRSSLVSGLEMMVGQQQLTFCRAKRGPCQ
jgi:hypothetical protein